MSKRQKSVHKFHSPRLNTKPASQKDDDYYLRIGKKMSKALRHAPWDYGIELDDYGWVDAQLLVQALRRRFGRDDIVFQDFKDIVEHSDKKRFEISGNRIRARYGHTVPVKRDDASAPPELLFHGTSRHAADKIVVEGLQPIERQFVHMSDNIPQAHSVGIRKDPRPVILTIRAGEAYRAGVKFYDGSDHIWLADFVPPEFIDR